MASSSPLFLCPLARSLLLSLASVALMVRATTGATSWCVARTNVSDSILQSAMDYACGAGADCAPIQPNGLCYLPNTVQSHASYAFNSFYQRKAMAPGSCDFAGTAAIAMSDPSYGSCAYPSSASTAGGTTPVTPATPTIINNPNTSPTTTTTPTFGGSDDGTGVGGLTPLGSSVPNTDENSKASLPSFPPVSLSLICLLSLLFSPI